MQTELHEIVTRFAQRTQHRQRCVRIHSVADGFLARQTLDGHHFLLVPWHRERPMFESRFSVDGDAMSGQRTAWQWRCYCCGRIGITVIDGSQLGALHRLQEFIALMTDQHTEPTA
jgi:hypothetical protein